MGLCFTRKQTGILLLLVGFIVCQGDPTVKLVYDGDTFELESGEKVRLEKVIDELHHFLLP